MSATYIWKDGKIVVYPIAFNVRSAVDHEVVGYPCVDDFCERGNPGRYGMFKMNYKGGYPSLWDAWSPESLPPEFRTHLLLLGVT